MKNVWNAPVLNDKGEQIDISGVKLGSIMYQDIMVESILYKTMNKIPLNPLEKSFIPVQEQVSKYPFGELLKKIVASL